MIKFFSADRTEATVIPGAAQRRPGIQKIRRSAWIPSFRGNDEKILDHRVLEITGGADLSEWFDVRPERDCLPAPGMLVSIDAQRPGGLSISKEAYDRKIAGIISGAGGINPGMLMGQKGTKADGASPVALNGRVYCWADASTGPIEPGDLLTSSDTHGHAMRASDCTKARGAILGKAMSRLKTGRGLVLVLVTLQ